MKLILIAILAVFCLNNVKAQAHNTGVYYNCKLKKGNSNSESYPCPACQAKDKKEIAAKKAEDKRRSEVIAAKIEAKKTAHIKAQDQDRLEKLRSAESKTAKETADSITQEAMTKKNKEIANKGQIKSNVKGENIHSKIDIENIKTFSDGKSRTYGFKIDDKEVLTFPFEGQKTYIERIKGTNYFQVTVNKPDGYANGVFSHSYLVNHLGEKMKVEGISTFDFPIGVWENTLYLFKNLSTPELCDNSYCYQGNPSFLAFFDSRESATAKLKTMIYKGGGLAMCQKFSFCHVAQYKVDFNCKFLEKTEGYQLRIIDK